MTCDCNYCAELPKACEACGIELALPLYSMYCQACRRTEEAESDYDYAEALHQREEDV